MSEAQYQAALRKRIETLFPGCVILKNDSRFLQGVPDLVIFWHDRYAFLEVKRSANEPYQPNQEYYLEQFGQMSFAAMICPENEKDVLDALQRSFLEGRHACLPQR